MTTAVFTHLKVVSLALPKINWKIFFFLLFLISLCLLIFYVWQVNFLINGSYLADGYEKQISKLSEQKKNLEVSFAENSFLGQAQEKIRAMNFQKTTSVKYIQIPDNFLARAK